MPVRVAFLLVAVAALGAPLAAAGQSVAEVAAGRAAYADGVVAYRAGDHAALLAAMERADRLRPAHPTVLVALASARALTGDARGAMATLGRLAQMGLAYDPAADADFAALADDPAAPAIRSWRVLAAARPEFEEPTGITLADGRLWLIANSHWDRFEGGVLREPDSLSPPLVVAIDPGGVLEN